MLIGALRLHIGIFHALSEGFHLLIRPFRVLTGIFHTLGGLFSLPARA